MLFLTSSAAAIKITEGTTSLKANDELLLYLWPASHLLEIMLADKDISLLWLYSEKTKEVIKEQIKELIKELYEPTSLSYEISIPASITSIQDTAFAHFMLGLPKFSVAQDNPSYSSSKDGRLLLSKDGTKLYIAKIESSLKSYRIPDGVVSIEGFVAFTNTFPTVISELMRKLFGGSTYFSYDYMIFPDETECNLIIPPSLAHIRNFNTVSAYSTSKLYSDFWKEITKDDENDAESYHERYDFSDLRMILGRLFPIMCGNITVESGNRHFYTDPTGTMLISRDGTLQGTTITNNLPQIPTGVTTIGAGAFSYTFNVTKLSIPEGVHWIEQDAFAFCDELETVVLPQSLIHIERDCVKKCSQFF